MSSIPVDLMMELKPVSPQAAAEYAGNKSKLIEFVNQELASRSGLGELIGGNPLRVMFDNHRNHAAFMSTVFQLNNFNLLVRILPWVYRAYHNQGFSFNYFPAALSAWIKAAAAHLKPEAASEITRVYQWIIDKHNLLIEQAQAPFIEVQPVDEAWRNQQARFLQALLKGDARAAVQLAAEAVFSNQDKIDFYLQVIQPSMYMVGTMWENGEISVAREHLASAVVTRVMSSLYIKSEPPEIQRGSAVLTAAPNEFHEIGPWMAADALESDGWSVIYLGSNTPQESLLNMLEEHAPRLLGLSLAMPYNLESARSIIAAVKSHPEMSQTKIMVGGLAFYHLPELWPMTGADGYASNCAEAVELARSWS